MGSTITGLINISNVNYFKNHLQQCKLIVFNFRSNFYRYAWYEDETMILEEQPSILTQIALFLCFPHKLVDRISSSEPPLLKLGRPIICKVIPDSAEKNKIIIFSTALIIPLVKLRDNEEFDAYLLLYQIMPSQLFNGDQSRLEKDSIAIVC